MTWSGAALCLAVALLACGAKDSGNDSHETVQSLSQAATSTATYTFNITLPVGASIVDTTIGSATTVLIGTDDKILGPISSAVGTVEVQPQGAAENITTGGAVLLDDRAVIKGNIHAGGTITTSSSASVSGKTTSSATGLSPFTTTWSVTNSAPSQGPITLQNNAVGAPSPGAYDAVVVNAGSSLYLSTGTYFLQSLDLESGANLVIDSRHGPVFAYLASSIIYRGHEEEVSGAIPRLFIGYFGTEQAILEAPFSGVFIAPNAALHLQNAPPTGDEGTFYGKSFTAEPSEIIKPGVFDWTQVPGMPPPPGGFAAHGGADGIGGPGTGATGGGTGGGSDKTPMTTIPPPAVSVHLAYRPPGDPDPTRDDTRSTTVTSSMPVPFYAPSTFDVGGVIANGTVTVAYTSCAGAAVTCTYKGGSSSSTPRTDLDVDAGRTVTLQSCSDGKPASAPRCGKSFTVSLVSTAKWPVTVDLALDARSCNTKVDLLTPLQTRQMFDSFSWPDPNQTLSLPPNQSTPLVAETNSDGTPTLYYGWVYLHNTEDLLRLRKMYVHVLSRPLLTQELAAYGGQCVQFQNPGDGYGTFVPAVIPGKVYNTIIETQNTKFQKDNGLQPGAPLFLAVILKSTTPLDFQVLKHSGFRYLDYEASPLPAQADMQLQGGVVAAALIDIVSFALNVVKDVGRLVTTALGALDALFASRVNYKIIFNASNLNAGFASPTMTRAWGPNAGAPLGAGGLHVEFLENLLGLFPLTFGADTDESGLAALSPAANGSNVLVDLGFCMELRNDAAWATSFLLPNEICNLKIFVDTALVTGFGGGVSNINLDIPDPSQDRTVPLTMSSPQLIAVYGMTDAQRYMQAVSGYSAQPAHVLVGDSANVVGWFKKPSTAFTMGMHLRNASNEDLTKILTPYLNNLGYATVLDGISTGGGSAGFSFGMLSVLVSIFANNDIVMPDSSAEGPTSREVGTHEFGHFILMNLFRDNSSTAIDNLIGDTMASGKGSNLNYSTRYINEAFADYISGQVTSIANYGWLQGQLEATGDPRSGHVCDQKPCFDNNFVAAPGSSTQDKSGISRVASLIHDAFDGQRNESIRELTQPTNADAWTLSKIPYEYTKTPWGDCDGPDLVNGLAPACRLGTGPQTPLSKVTPCMGTAGGTCIASESAAMPGKFLVDFGHALQASADANQRAQGGPYLTDQTVFAALDQSMEDAGLTWCQRCQVLALHVPENASDSLDPISLLSLCYRGSSNNPKGDSSLMSWKLPLVRSSAAPDPDLRLDAYTCQTCPPTLSPDQNGQCTLQCPADVVIDGASTPPGTEKWETTTTTLSTDTCPGLFVIEIENPDQLFTHGAVSISASAVVDVPSQQSCTRPFSLTYADLPSSAGSFVNVQVDSTTGSFSAGGGLLIGPSCVGLPAITIPSAGQLTFGSSPIRFVTSVTPGVFFNLDAPLPPIVPR